MRVWRPPGVLAGFAAGSGPRDAAEIMDLGEQWVPRHFAIGRHSHTYWEIYLQASGQARWQADGRSYNTEPNAIYVAPPGVVHALVEFPPARHHFYFAIIDVDTVLQRLSGLPPAWPCRQFTVIENGGSLTAPFRLLVRETSLSLPYGDAGLRAALDALVVEASRLIAGAPTAEAPLYRHPAVDYVRQLIEQNLGRGWTVSELAETAGLSAAYLAECFTRDIGVPPHQYMLQCRIATAEEYLRMSDLSITDIALELGFSSSQNFATTFKRLSGRTPREVRADRGFEEKGSR